MAARIDSSNTTFRHATPPAEQAHEARRDAQSDATNIPCSPWIVAKALVGSFMNTHRVKRVFESTVKDGEGEDLVTLTNGALSSQPAVGCHPRRSILAVVASTTSLVSSRSSASHESHPLTRAMSRARGNRFREPSTAWLCRHTPSRVHFEKLTSPRSQSVRVFLRMTAWRRSASASHAIASTSS